MRSLTLALGALVLSASASLAQEPSLDLVQPARHWERGYYGPPDGTARVTAITAARVTATAGCGTATTARAGMARRRAMVITEGGSTAVASGGSE